MAKRIIPVYFSSAKGRYQFPSVDIFGSHSTPFKAEKRLKKRREISNVIPVFFSRFMTIWFIYLEEQNIPVYFSSFDDQNIPVSFSRFNVNIHH